MATEPAEPVLDVTVAQQVPYTGSEKQSLRVSLDRHRDVVLWKLEGLSDVDLRRCMLPSGNSLLGLVKHLASWEYAWFCRTFGHPSEALPFDQGDEDADQVMDEVDLDDTGTTMFGDVVSLRWVLIHVLEDTARHAGHVDIMRELIDGMVGFHQPA